MNCKIETTPGEHHGQRFEETDEEERTRLIPLHCRAHEPLGLYLETNPRNMNNLDHNYYNYSNYG